MNPDMITIQVDRATPHGRLIWDVHQHRPRVLEARYQERSPYGGYPPELVEHDLQLKLHDIARQERHAIISEHGHLVDGALHRRWALAVPLLPAPPDPAVAAERWRSTIAAL